MRKRVVELFAGVGGFRVGLSRSTDKYDFVWANQWEPSRKVQHAFNCYTHHFGESEIHTNIDIGEVDKTTIPDHDLLVGGFPCQDYSVATVNAEGIQGKKGVLWWSINEIVEKKKPTYILLENVDRLMKSPAKQRGRDFGVILSCLGKQGYTVEWRVINAAEYGFPQRRKRVFIFAYKDNERYGESMQDAELGEIVKERGIFQKEFRARMKEGGKELEVEVEIEDIQRVSDSFESVFYNAGVMRKGLVYTVEMESEPEEVCILQSVLERGVGEKYYPSEDEIEGWRYLKGSKRFERVNKEGHTYIYSEGAIAFPDPIERAARTMLTSEGAKNRCSHLIEDPETKRYRKLTPIECERLNGFPDGWTETGMTERTRYFCMGNALVVGVVERLGRQIAEL